MKTMLPSRDGFLYCHHLSTSRELLFVLRNEMLNILMDYRVGVASLYRKGNLPPQIDTIVCVGGYRKGSKRCFLASTGRIQRAMVVESTKSIFNGVLGWHLSGASVA